jgi:PST family polysaccharide transporter
VDQKIAEKKNTIKATSIIAISQFLILLIGVIKTKIFAIFLGPSGIGILGLYQSTIDLIKNISGLGLNFSSVREISKSNELGREELRTTWAIIKKWMKFGSLFGIITTILLSKKLSYWAFGEDVHFLEFSFLSITIFFSIYYNTNISFLQGTRQIKRYAKTQLYSALGGLIFSVPIIILLKIDGIVLSIIVFGLSQLIISSIMCTKVLPSFKKISNKFAIISGQKMIQLGAITVLASLLSTGTLYAMRIFISQKIGVFYVGIFQAGTTLSMIYLMTILQAMSTDYYPRLSANQDNYKKLNDIANDQVELVLNISSLMIIIMLTFLPFVLKSFYSKEFLPAIPMLQWQISSAFFRIAAYPLSYILLAKGKGVSYFLSELTFNAFFLLTTFLFWDNYLMESIGIGITIAYFLYFLTNYFLVKRSIKFNFSKTNIYFLTIYFTLIVISFSTLRFLSTSNSILTNSVMIIIALILSYRYINSIFDLKNIIQKFVKK